ncbi:MAG: hypothetical protein MI741_15385 [Rhodospirillales bacterium]|nr:hypothetical protein [Rhodospirillales bacterium]
MTEVVAKRFDAISSNSDSWDLPEVVLCAEQSKSKTSRAFYNAREIGRIYERIILKYEYF